MSPNQKNWTELGKLKKDKETAGVNLDINEVIPNEVQEDNGVKEGKVLNWIDFKGASYHIPPHILAMFGIKDEPKPEEMDRVGEVRTDE